MKCDLCDASSTVHMTEIRDGVKQERHLCETHAREVIPSLEDPQVRAQKLADCNRRTIAFITENNRAPTSEESARLDLAYTSAASGERLAQLTRMLQELVKFIDEHGRTPTGGELDLEVDDS